MRLISNLRFTALACLAAAALAACATGQVRRVSEPMASIQQLTVQADGQWQVDVRMQNFSSIPMRFERLDVRLTTDTIAAGQLQAQPSIEIGPESADVITIQMQPSAEARMHMAAALSANRAIQYRLEGSTDAVPQDGRSRNFKLERSSSLSPVPGLVGVLR